MLHKNLAFLTVAASTVFLSSSAHAQGDNGFLRGQGNVDTVLSYTRDYYDEFWVGDTKVADPGVGEVTRESWTLYGAYGLRPDMDLFASATYVDAESDGTAPIPDETDVQDLIVGMKWRFFERRVGSGAFSLLVAPSIKQPLGDYPDNQVTAIGDGQTDLRGRVIGHYQMDNGLYFALESGYDRRNGAPEDEIPINATLGFTVFERLTLSPFYSQVMSDGGIDISDVPALGGFPAVEEEFTRYGVSAYYRIDDRFGLTGMWRTTEDGKNTGDADSFALGVVLKL